MFTNKPKLLSAAAIAAFLLGAGAASAADPQCFTLASLQGNYAVVGNFGSNVAMALAAQNLDGNGNLTRSAIVNQPTTGSTTGARTLTATRNTGTYTVNCDGTGVITRVVTQASGATSTVVDDFMITDAVMKHGIPVATTIVSAQQTPSVVVPGGIFVTFVHTRLPDRAGSAQ